MPKQGRNIKGKRISMRGGVRILLSRNAAAERLGQRAPLPRRGQTEENDRRIRHEIS